MKTQITQQITKLALVAFTAFLVAGVAQANECGMSPTALADTQELAKKIHAQFSDKTPPEIVKVSAQASNNVLDHKFHKIDRSKKGFKQFDSVGILTGEKFENKVQAYGSATLISPCHVLTNRHVVKGLVEKRIEKNGKDSEAPFSTGSLVYFSVGQAKSCDSGNDFRMQNLNAKVVDFGKDESVEQDWAIVKLNQPISSSEIEPSIVYTNPLVQGKLGLRVGFPWSEVKDGSGFKNSRAQYVKGVSGNGGGVIRISDDRNLNGLSGGSVFALDPANGTQLYSAVTGVYVGSDYVLSASAILDSMKVNNRGTFEDIQKALKTGSCQ